MQQNRNGEYVDRISSPLIDSLAAMLEAARAGDNDGFDAAQRDTMLLRHACSGWPSLREKIDLLLDAVYVGSVKNWPPRDIPEVQINRHFIDNVALYIPGATIVRRAVDRKHIPDAWVEVNGGCWPVEIKSRSFDTAAVNQLARYMKRYGSQRGYAVGRKLTGKLKAGMIFVPHQECRHG